MFSEVSACDCWDLLLGNYAGKMVMVETHRRGSVFTLWQPGNLEEKGCSPKQSLSKIIVIIIINKMKSKDLLLFKGTPGGPNVFPVGCPIGSIDAQEYLKLGTELLMHGLLGTMQDV